MALIGKRTPCRRTRGPTSTSTRPPANTAPTTCGPTAPTGRKAARERTRTSRAGNDAAASDAWPASWRHAARAVDRAHVDGADRGDGAADVQRRGLRYRPQELGTRCGSRAAPGAGPGHIAARRIAARAQPRGAHVSSVAGRELASPAREDRPQALHRAARPLER